VSKEPKWTKGQEVYSLNGQAFNFLEKTQAGYLVEEILEYDEWEEPRYGHPRIVDEVFNGAPTAKYDERISILQKRIDTLTHHQSELMEKTGKAEEFLSEINKRAEKLAPLQRLLDLIDGKITHAVSWNYGSPKISKLEDVLKGKDRWDKWLKLVTLFGKNNGDLSFKVNEYSDGSGSNTEIFPCKSDEDGRLQIIEKIKRDMPLKKDSRWKITSWVIMALQYDIPVSDEYMQIADEETLKTRNSNISNAKQSYEDAARRLEKAQKSSPSAKHAAKSALSKALGETE